MHFPFIVGTAVVLAGSVAYVCLKARHDRIKSRLTPDGALVKVLIHAEAPEDALFLGDLQTESCNNLDFIKKDLCNQTARLGGDPMVLDDIQSHIYDGQTWGYIGIGRAYKTSSRPRLPEEIIR